MVMIDLAVLSRWIEQIADEAVTGIDQVASAPSTSKR